MLNPSSPERTPRGQIIVVFALSLTLILFAVGLAVDGGNGLAQRRASQNASDFAAMAGARIMAEYIDETNNGGVYVNGTDLNVKDAIKNAIAANGGAPATFGSPDGPRYVSDNGALLTFVGSGTIPTGATGVKVHSTRDFKPFFLGVFGIAKWTAGADRHRQGRVLDRRAATGHAVSRRHLARVFPDLSLLLWPDQHGPVRSVLSAAPDARQPERAGRLRLAEVRVRRLVHWASGSPA